MLKVGWNATLLGENPAGVGNYIERVMEELGKLSKEESFDLVPFGTGKYDFSRIGLRENARLFPEFLLKNKFIRILWEHTLLPSKILRADLDIFHSPAHVIPFFNGISGTKQVVTFHDLVFKTYPDSFKNSKGIYLNTVVPRTLSVADKIIAVSRSTKNDLIEEYGVEEERIAVIYNGVDDNYCVLDEAEDLEETKAEYELPDRFILYLGTLEPRKNLKRLIKAYSIIRDKASIPDEVKLVLAGGKGWLYDDIFELVEKKGLEDQVIFPGYIAGEHLVELYNLAELFAYPSLYEGFGLPSLEAMACGTPVVTSNVSSLPEVVGDAAITIDPYDVDELAEQMANVVTSRDLSQNLIEKGKERVDKFSWRKTAEETLKVYKSMV